MSIVLTLGVQHDTGEILHVLSSTVPRRSFLPNPGPDKEITLSSDWSLIGPELLPSIPPFRGLGPAAGAAPPVEVWGVAAEGMGAPPPGVSRAVDSPCAPCTIVTVLLAFSSGAVCAPKSAFRCQPPACRTRTWASVIGTLLLRSMRVVTLGQMEALLHCPGQAQLLTAHLTARVSARSKHLPCDTAQVGHHRSDVGARPSDCAQENQGAGRVVLYCHQERPNELDDDWRRVWRPKTSSYL